MPPPPSIPSSVPPKLPQPPKLTPSDLKALHQRRQYLEHRLTERGWIWRTALGFVVAVLGMIAVAHACVLWSLREQHHAVRAALVRVRDAERVLRDLQVVESHAPNHPESYLILQRQRDVILRRREDYNLAVARYNRTSDLQLALWMYRWLDLPPQHRSMPLAE